MTSSQGPELNWCVLIQRIRHWTHIKKELPRTAIRYQGENNNQSQKNIRQKETQMLLVYHAKWKHVFSCKDSKDLLLLLIDI